MPPHRAATTTHSQRLKGRKYQTIVVKLGTGLLTHGGAELNLDIIRSLVGQIALLHQEGVDIVLVTSGAVAAGRNHLGVSELSTNVIERQALAAVGQVQLMSCYAELFSRRERPIMVAQAMLTRRDIVGNRLSYLNARNTLAALLRRQVVPIINENDVVAVDELLGEAFGDNDHLSAMVANLVDADLLALLGEVGGLYSKDPNVHPGNAELVPEVRDLDWALREMARPSWGGKGRGGMVTKLEAARLPTASGTDVMIASGLVDNILARLAVGDLGEGKNRVCTLVPATGTKTESRKRWMAAGRSAGGAILVDAGAAEALLRHSGSLLPAGITSVTGRFERGDIVPIFQSKDEIACGFTNYGSGEVDRIKGAQSHEIEDILGYHFGQEVVHRNDMMVLGGPQTARTQGKRS